MLPQGEIVANADQLLADLLRPLTEAEEGRDGGSGGPGREPMAIRLKSGRRKQAIGAFCELSMLFFTRHNEQEDSSQREKVVAHVSAISNFTQQKEFHFKAV